MFLCFKVCLGYADVVKFANTHGSEPCAARLVGSSPTIGTILVKSM